MEVGAHAQVLQEEGKELDAVTRRYGVDVVTVEKWLEQVEAGETPEAWGKLEPFVTDERPLKFHNW